MPDLPGAPGVPEASHVGEGVLEAGGRAPAVAPATGEVAGPRAMAMRAHLAVFVFAHLAHHLGTGAMAPVLPLVRDSFGLDYTRAGLLISAQALALGAAQFPVSALGDHMSKPVLMAIGLLGVGAVGLAIAGSWSYWQLVALLALTGVLAASYHAPASAFLSSIFGGASRGRALGTHVIGGAVAFSATPLVALEAARITGSWRTAFLVLAIPPIVAGVLLLALYARRPSPREVTSAAGGAEPVRLLASLGKFGPLVGVSLVEQLLTASLFAFIPLFMVDRHHIPPDRAGLVIALITGVGIIAAPAGGALSDRFGRAPVLLLSSAVVGPLIILLANVPLGWPLVVVLVVYGIASNTRMPVLESLVADVVPARRRATVLGLYYFVGQESAALATPLVGQLFDTVGPASAFTLVGALGTAAALLLVLAWRPTMSQLRSRASG